MTGILPSLSDHILPRAPRSYYQSKQVSRHIVAFQSKSLLTDAQEQALISHIKRLTERGIPPTPSMVRNFATDIGKVRPGKNWVYKFVKRHAKDLDSRYLTNLITNLLITSLHYRHWKGLKARQTTATASGEVRSKSRRLIQLPTLYIIQDMARDTGYNEWVQGPI
jgi:Tc5 transposase DNA-binding domain